MSLRDAFLKGLREGQPVILNGGFIHGVKYDRLILDDPYESARRPGETDEDFRNRVLTMFTPVSGPGITWVNGDYYPTEREKGLFGRVVQTFTDWGELRRQKKSPHTQVLYVWTLKESPSPIGAVEKVKTLGLRSINNCDNNQLQQAIQLAGMRLEEKKITQQDAELILDMCYAELQRRLAWTDREKAKRESKITQEANR